MEKPDLRDWDAARYKELNEYFRVRIRTMLESDPYLQELVEVNKSLELEQLIERMSFKDQNLWEEFIKLDQLKFHQHLYDHFEGKGRPYNSRTGFNNSELPGDDNSTW
jgi:hypothetical protein